MASWPAEAWQRFVELFRRRRQPHTAQPNPPSQAPHQRQSDRNYDVNAASGRFIGGSDTLQEALGTWKELTDSLGRIIDNATGEDITPEPDDKGRYVVFDAAGEQLASFDSLPRAARLWEDATDGNGRIIDTQQGEDVTPSRKGVLTAKQQQVIMAAAGKNWLGRNSLQVDEALVRSFLAQITRLPVPVFDVSNIVGRGKPVPTKRLPIKRREVKVELVRKQVLVDVPGKPQPSGSVVVPYPTDNPELQRLRRVREIPRLTRSQLGVPIELLYHRVARRQGLVRVYEEEVADTPTVSRRLEWREIEQLTPREWTEMVEVAEEPQAQLLEIVIDVSGSMSGSSINLAVAMALAVLGAHLDDDSRYFYRQFASQVGTAIRAGNRHEKEKLAHALMDQDNSLGGGTSIMLAISAAAEDVRATARTDDHPQVLLITDGQDSAIDSAALYKALGKDVILHTAVVNSSNNTLAAKSSTYYELRADGGTVRGSSGYTPSDWY